MFDRTTLDRISDRLVARAGGYLRNTIREPYLTCDVCATPVDGYKLCAACHRHAAEHGGKLADAVGALTYAVRRSQAAYMMLGYKAAHPPKEHVAVVSLLTWAGIGLHRDCAARLLGMPVTHWAAVPSLPPKPGPHPFHPIVSASLHAGQEIALNSVAGVASPRSTAQSHFTTAAALPARSHVLVVDDTWTQGGHAQSAALTLRQAGADKISILAAARWINTGYGNNDEFVNSRLTEDFNPQICPWTDGACP